MHGSIEQRRLLTELALLASIMNDTGRARRIAGGLDPASTGAAVALGLAALTDGDPAQAVEHLGRAAGDADAAGLLAVAKNLASGGPG